MRAAACLIGICLTTWACADRLILAPTAHALPSDEFRAETWFGGEDNRFGAVFVSAAYGGFEAQYRWVDLDQRAQPGALDLAYDYISPIGDISPGISAGVMDIANVTPDGRREYVCATMNRRGLLGIRNGYVELTAGLAIGRKTGPIVGFRAPVARNLSLLGEYDGIRFSTSLQVDLRHGAYAGVTFSEGSAFLTLGGRF